MPPTSLPPSVLKRLDALIPRALDLLELQLQDERPAVAQRAAEILLRYGTIREEEQPPDMLEILEERRRQYAESRGATIKPPPEEPEGGEDPGEDP